MRDAAFAALAAPKQSKSGVDDVEDDDVQEALLRYFWGVSNWEAGAALIGSDASAVVAAAAKTLRADATASTDKAIASVGVLHNLSRWPSTSAVVGNAPEAVQALTHALRATKSSTARLTAAMALANVVGGDEAKSFMLVSDEGVLGDIVDVLGEVLSASASATQREASRERERARTRTQAQTRARRGSRAAPTTVAPDTPTPTGWMLAEPLQAIRSLCLVKANRTFFTTKADVVQLLVRSIRVALDANDAVAADNAIGALQQLAFDGAAAVAEIERRQGELLPLLRLVAARKEQDAWAHPVQSAEYLAFDVWPSESLYASSQPPKATPQALDGNGDDPDGDTRPRVMISYSWAQQPLARRVDEEPTRRGARVWRDERNMAGSVVEAMANAVLSSDFFVCLISKAYVASANCQKELHFADHHKKRIIPLVAEANFDFGRTWLQLLIADALYYTIVPETELPQAVGQFFETEIAAASLHGAKAALGASESEEPPQPPWSGAQPPTTPAGVESWVAALGLPPSVASALLTSGFTDKDSLTSLRVFDPKQAADALGVSVATVARLFRGIDAFSASTPST